MSRTTSIAGVRPLGWLARVRAHCKCLACAPRTVTALTLEGVLRCAFTADLPFTFDISVQFSFFAVPPRSLHHRLKRHDICIFRLCKVAVPIAMRAGDLLGPFFLNPGESSLRLGTLLQQRKCAWELGVSSLLPVLFLRLGSRCTTFQCEKWLTGSLARRSRYCTSGSTE
jgi:hypothetical protein